MGRVTIANLGKGPEDEVKFLASSLERDGILNALTNVLSKLKIDPSML